MTKFFDNFHVAALGAQLLAILFYPLLVAAFGPYLTGWKRNTLHLLLATAWLWGPWAIYGSYRAYMAVHNVSITVLRSVDAPSAPERPL